MKVRRATTIGFALEDQPEDPLIAAITGNLTPPKTPVWTAASPLTGQRLSLSTAQVKCLATVPQTGWTSAATLRERSGCGAQEFAELLDAGLLLSNARDGRQSALRERDRYLRNIGWSPAALSYHLATVASGQGGAIDDELMTAQETDAAFERQIAATCERYGEPPPAFHERTDVLTHVDLPLVEPPRESTPLQQVLGERTTCRHFDSTRALSLTTLAYVLRTVFGATGSQRFGESYTILRKHTPSAGALHPIDAYPLIQGVEGVPTGLYHYEVAKHRLAQLERMDEVSARQFAALALYGQRYWEDAHCVLLLVARFDRHFWKYRDHPKAYKAVLMDAGHLSQTLYLVGSDLGLGTFVCAAVNDGDINTRLSLDGVCEGTVAACGIGVAAPRDPRAFTSDA